MWQMGLTDNMEIPHKMLTVASLPQKENSHVLSWEREILFWDRVSIHGTGKQVMVQVVHGRVWDRTVNMHSTVTRLMSDSYSHFRFDCTWGSFLVSLLLALRSVPLLPDGLCILLCLGLHTSHTNWKPSFCCGFKSWNVFGDEACFAPLSVVTHDCTTKCSRSLELILGVWSYLRQS